MAAQALVRESYKDPIGTFETNVIGTLNTLEAMKNTKSIKAALIITTDKVYKNVNKLEGYIESDPLGGDDPYSASKAAADLAAQSWINSYASFPIAIARAGNVIGAGDWAKDRLIPDLIDAYSKDKTPILRFPNSVRPWQHVLDCLTGYLSLIEYQLKFGLSGEWNFGPEIQVENTVVNVASRIALLIKSENTLKQSIETNPDETGYLLLNSSKARNELNWKEKLDFERTLDWTFEGYQKQLEGMEIQNIMKSQIESFLEIK